MSCPATPSYHSERLVYRAALPSNKEDVKFINEMYSDPYTYMRLDAGPLRPWKETEGETHLKSTENALASWMICVPKDPSSANLAKIGQQDLVTVGWMCLVEKFGMLHRRCGIAIGMHPDHQGKGYGPEALNHLVKYAFQTCNMRKIEMGAFAWNEPAVKAYQKCGFHVEATRKENFWFEGKYWDEIFLALFRRDWLKSQGLEETFQIE